MFARVVPTNQSFQYQCASIFRFRFWQYDKWVEVVVDDRLPTFKGKLLYERSSQWILECCVGESIRQIAWLIRSTRWRTHKQSDARFYGRFDRNLRAKSEIKTANSLPNVYRTVQTEFIDGMQYLFTFRCNRSWTGLIAGHAYSITKMVRIQTINMSIIRMMRLRNSWGSNVERNGVWSDQSPEWLSVSWFAYPIWRWTLDDLSRLVEILWSSVHLQFGSRLSCLRKKSDGNK